MSSESDASRARNSSGEDGPGTGPGPGAGPGAGTPPGTGSDAGSGTGSGNGSGTGSGGAPVAGPEIPYGPNAARVLGFLRTAGEQGADRGELALRTGLTPQAVSKITARLRSHGLVAEAGRRASTGGKPSTVLRLAPAARHAVGIQLDRDQLTAVLVDLTGGVVAGRTAPLDLGADSDVLLDAVESAVHGLIGAALPGVEGVRASGLGGAEDQASAEGGELWRQITHGDKRTARRPSGTRSGAPRPNAPSTAAAPEERADAAHADARRAVAEEGELWRDDTGHATPAGGGNVRDVRATETGAGAPEYAPGDREGPGGPGADADPEQTGDAPDAGKPGTRWGSVVGVGVAAPGPLDHARGVLGPVTGLPDWTGFPLRDSLARRLGLPVVLDKDTNAAALGLAPRGRESLAYLHFGTGIGAGLVLDGRLHRGRRTGAGEFGHQVLQLDGPRCRCGRHGCLEALCMAAVRDGRPAEAARLLGIGAANLVRLLDVDRVLLGGRTVLAAPDTFVDGVAARLRAEAGTGDGPGAVRVELAPEGARTVADGAAQLVLAPLFGQPSGGAGGGG